MYKNFISNICQESSLVNIAILGKARQSSYSKWSRENDAQRAVDGNDYPDYAFHTDIQVNPWWEIEFDSESFVHTIIINNRKRTPFDEIASNIEVAAYDKQGLETILHQGKVFFGSVPYSMPLILPMKGKLPIKKVRITLKQHAYLHLSSIHILSVDILKKFGSKNIFLAGRGDGFGERLRAMLNAMVLANKMEAKFVFKWPSSFSKSQHHAIDTAHSIFNDEFITKHMVFEQDLQEVNKIELSALKTLTNSNRSPLINLNQNYLKTQLKGKSIVPDNIEQKYRIAFDSIGFNKEAQSAINTARALKLKNKTVAIHLRSGDIVYELYRFMDRFHVKVVPFYVLDALIRKYQHDGYDVILFSQDVQACQYFETKFGVSISANLADYSYNNIQQALFDIVLMSRCSEVVCGSSGFAILASWIGKAKQLRYQNILSSQDIQASFNASLGNQGFLTSKIVPPLLKSFSIVHYLQAIQDNIATEDRINLLQQAIVLDVDNDFYRFLLALTLYQNNRDNDAEKLLFQTLENEGLGSMQWLIKTKLPSKTIFSSDYIEDYITKLNKYAQYGNLIAAYISLKVSLFDESIKFDVEFYKEILKKSSKDVLGYSLLKDALQNLE